MQYWLSEDNETPCDFNQLFNAESTDLAHLNDKINSFLTVRATILLKSYSINDANGNDYDNDSLISRISISTDPEQSSAMTSKQLVAKLIECEKRILNSYINS